MLRLLQRVDVQCLQSMEAGGNLRPTHVNARHNVHLSSNTICFAAPQGAASSNIIDRNILFRLWQGTFKSTFSLGDSLSASRDSDFAKAGSNDALRPLSHWLRLSRAALAAEFGASFFREGPVAQSSRTRNDQKRRKTVNSGRSDMSWRTGVKVTLSAVPRRRRTI